ncbi:MAG: DNA translocase FtsK [Anaerolineae bacterium]
MAQRRSTSRRSTRKKTASGPTYGPQVTGLLLLALALLTIVALLTSNRSVLLEGWIVFLTRMVGWGRFIVWLPLGLLGVWFLGRYGAEDYDERWEKPLGAVMLFALLLALFHIISPGQGPLAVDEAGGGGLLGWMLGELLVAGLGVAGSVVLILFLGAVAIILISGLSLRELLGLIRDLYYRFQDWRHFSQLPINQPSLSLEAPRVPWWRRLFRRADAVAPLEADFPPLSGRSSLAEPPPQASSQPPAPVAAPQAVDAQRAATGEKLTPHIVGGQQWHLPLVAEVFDEGLDHEISEAEIRMRARIIEETLAGFGIESKVKEINPGPTVTQFGLEPLPTRDSKGNLKRVRVSRIVNLANDLALALSASPVRIEAPIPGRPYVGIEVPNKTTSLVTLRSVLESDQFIRARGSLLIALGRDVSGRSVVTDLSKLPHLLIAGATGSGKSVCLNSIICCLLTTHTPNSLRVLMIDPKMVELVQYNGMPHLLAPVVTDLEQVVGVLGWATREMDRRYKMFAKASVRNIAAYNELVMKQGEERLPYIVIIVDELADLMMLAPDEVERTITRIAQMARATGIHLIIATQRPSVDVVTGLIKANFPARVAFAVSSQVDSRVILDTPGAERLLGKGDMLWMAPDSPELARLQGVFVSDTEVERLVAYWKRLAGSDTIAARQTVRDPGPLRQQALWSELQPKESVDPEEAMLQKAIEVVRSHERASISLLQRRLRIGYARAARLIDQMEEQGIIGPEEGGGRGRKVLAGDEGPGASPGADGQG